MVEKIVKRNSEFVFKSGEQLILGPVHRYTLRSVNDVTEGSTQEAHMSAS